MKKILLMSVSAGAGHVRAAQALEAWAKEGFRDVETLHVDVMDYVPKSFRRIYVDTYLKLVEYTPALWGFVYKRMGSLSPEALTQRLRRVVERLNTRALGKVFESFQPDAVICTHFLPAEILMRKIAKGEWNRPVWVQITDFNLHNMWLMPNMRGYFVSNEEVAFRLRENGIAAERIRVTGIPVMPGFAQRANRAACRAEQGLAPDRSVLLLMGGGAGLGGMEKVAENLLRLEGNFQLIALAGKNEETLAALRVLAEQHPERLFPHGFTDRVDALMACADLIVTKPGGLTSSECLARELPMILHAPIPGQEERNADYLMEQGVAWKAVDAMGLTYKVGRLMTEPQQLQTMRECASAIARPFAAREVLQTVLDDLASSG